MNALVRIGLDKIQALKNGELELELGQDNIIGICI